MLVKDKQQLIKLLRPLTGGVLITGQSGSAKSTIAHTLRDAGLKTWDLDDDGQHCKFKDGTDLWIVNPNAAKGYNYVVGTGDNLTECLEYLKPHHVVLPSLQWTTFVNVMKSKAEDHAKRHGSNIWSDHWMAKAKWSRSQYERSLKENLHFWRAQVGFYGFTIHSLTLETQPDRKDLPWARKGL